MIDLYWLSKEHYQQIDGKFVLKRWLIRIDVIYVHRKGEQVKCSNRVYKENMVILVGHNKETGAWHSDAFDRMPEFIK